MIIDIPLSSTKSSKIQKTDILTLHLKDSERNDFTVILKVKVEEILTDKPKCKGCGVSMEDMEVFEFHNAKFCQSCFERRKAEAVSRNQAVSKKVSQLRKKGLVKDFNFNWNG